MTEVNNAVNATKCYKIFTENGQNFNKEFYRRNYYKQHYLYYRFICFEYAYVSLFQSWEIRKSLSSGVMNGKWTGTPEVLCILPLSVVCAFVKASLGAEVLDNYNWREESHAAFPITDKLPSEYHWTQKNHARIR